MSQTASAATAELCPLLPAIHASAIAALRHLLEMPSTFGDEKVLAAARLMGSAATERTAVHDLLDVVDQTQAPIQRVAIMRDVLMNADEEADYPDDYEARAHANVVRLDGRRKLVDLDAEEGC